MSDVFINKIKSFKWSDLEGKQLKIHVGYDNDYVSVIGIDEKNKIYILYSGKSHEEG